MRDKKNNDGLGEPGHAGCFSLLVVLRDGDIVDASSGVQSLQWAAAIGEYEERIRAGPLRQ